MENDGIVKHGFVFIRKDRMDQVRLDQDDIAGVYGDQAILILKISCPAFYIIQLHLPVPVQRHPGKIVRHAAVIIAVGNLHGAMLAFFFCGGKHYEIPP